MTNDLDLAWGGITSLSLELYLLEYLEQDQCISYSAIFHYVMIP